MTTLWQHIYGLEGRSLETLERRKRFKVIAVADSHLVIQPGEDGAERRIQRQTIEAAWSRLARQGELSQDEIKSRFSSRNGPYIAAILSKMPKVSYRRETGHLFHRP
jgi:hypothetical protein